MESVSVTSGFLHTHERAECYGCEACSSICPKSAISMTEDKYGFRYPLIDETLCINCGLCHMVCPAERVPDWHAYIESYGGYINDRIIREQSTSGGAFSAILNAFFSRQKDVTHYAYGAVAKGLNVNHGFASTYEDCGKFRSSKYTQSHICNTYSRIANELQNGFFVLFSGTPCEVSGLLNYLSLKRINQDNLVTIEVLCAGVPTPVLFRKYGQWIENKYGYPIKDFFWRYKDGDRWDYNCCSYVLQNGKRKVIDRWFSGYWSLFTQRLLMRPSCEKCPYKGSERVADISLGDLWGVDKEYPELYDNNRGTSWILCNTKKGAGLFHDASSLMTYIEVDFMKMEKYQIPSIHGKAFHPQYNEFMNDLLMLDYERLCRKWGKKPTIKLLWKKYFFNNAYRVRIWKIKRKINTAYYVIHGKRKSDF